MDRNLKIYKIIPQDSGLTAIAITDEPATEDYFVAFSSEEVSLQFSEDKRIITGAVMTPGKLIYRNHPKLGEFYATYDEEGVQRAAELFFRNFNKFNVEHSNTVADITPIESYFSKGEDGNVKGTWIMTARVNSDKLWDEIKKGNFSGYSFQANFMLDEVQMFSKTNTKKMEYKEKILQAINAILFSTDEPVVEPIVEPIVEPVVEPTPDPIIVEPVAEVEPIVDPRDEAIENLRKQIEEMQSKIDKYGEQLIVPVVSTEVIQGAKGSGKNENPALEYFK